jgi:hypothetical protein
MSLPESISTGLSSQDCMVGRSACFSKAIQLPCGAGILPTSLLITLPGNPRIRSPRHKRSESPGYSNVMKINVTYPRRLKPELLTQG